MTKTMMGVLVVGVIVLFGVIGALLYFNPFESGTTDANKGGQTTTKPDDKPVEKTTWELTISNNVRSQKIVEDIKKGEIYKLEVAKYEIAGYNIVSVSINGISTTPSANQVIDITMLQDTKVVFTFEVIKTGAPVTPNGNRLDLAMPLMR